MFGYTPDFSNNYFIKRQVQKMKYQMANGSSEVQIQKLLKLQLKIHLNNSFKKIAERQKKF